AEGRLGLDAVLEVLDRDHGQTGDVVLGPNVGRAHAVRVPAPPVERVAPAMRDDFEEAPVLQLLELRATPEIDALRELLGRRILAHQRGPVERLVVVGNDHRGGARPPWRRGERRPRYRRPSRTGPTVCAARWRTPRTIPPGAPTRATSSRRRMSVPGLHYTLRAGPSHPSLGSWWPRRRCRTSSLSGVGTIGPCTRRAAASFVSPTASSN